jgi:hypothetical protein
MFRFYTGYSSVFLKSWFAPAKKMNASDNNGSKTIANLGIAERLRSKLFFTNQET